MGFVEPVMRADRESVLAAVQENGRALQFADPVMRAEITQLAALAGISGAEYAHAVSHLVVINVHSVDRTSDRTARVLVSTLGGMVETINVDIDDESTTAALR